MLFFKCSVNLAAFLVPVSNVYGCVWACEGEVRVLVSDVCEYVNGTGCDSLGHVTSF